MPRKSKKTIFREMFLREFFKQILIEVNPSPIEEIKEPKLRKEIEKTVIMTPEKPKPQDSEEMLPGTETVPDLSMGHANPEANKYPIPGKTIQQPQIPIKRQAPRPPVLQTQKPGEGIGKLATFLRDPAIRSIECPGPDKEIVIDKAGVIQPSNIKLNEAEIDSTMQEISQKTRIPLIQGVFKAALNNLLITAVISEFTGTRFIIQKNPNTASMQQRY